MFKTLNSLSSSNMRRRSQTLLFTISFEPVASSVPHSRLYGAGSPEPGAPIAWVRAACATLVNFSYLYSLCVTLCTLDFLSLKVTLLFENLHSVSSLTFSLPQIKPIKRCQVTLSEECGEMCKRVSLSFPNHTGT